MKNYLKCAWLLLSILPCISSSAQSGNLRFKASVKTSENQIIPTAYIKIYKPGEWIAIDSFFTDEMGKIDRELPFISSTDPSSVNLSPGNDLIIKKIHPNVISGIHTNLSVVYNYPGSASLFFMDIKGRVFPNHTELSNGFYLYFLSFEDGNKSELQKIMIAEKTRLSVSLVNVYENSKQQKAFSTVNEGLESFCAGISKDGFVSLRDSIIIDSITMERHYQMDAASIPTVNFTYSGELEVGMPIVFNASSSSGAYDEALDFSWNFGNGKSGGSVITPHLYTLPGNYEVTLTATGKYGAKHSQNQTLTIKPGPVAAKFTGMVNGFITDEYLTELGNVKVSLVEAEETDFTTPGGMVHLSGLPVGIPLHLKLIKDGYVTQMVEVTIPESSEEAHFFTSLKSRSPKMILTNAEFGGELVGKDGTEVILPVEAFVKPDGTPVRGDVNVNITPVDVAFETSSFPGSFLAFREDGEDGVLLSYGVSEFYFEQDNEELQLAPGKKASVLIPVYTSGTQPGVQIPLWTINEDNGMWVQEGMGTVVESQNSPTGLAFQAEVSHFSWFNCDDFMDERKRKALCYRWECSSAICVKVIVGCWMSGAMRQYTSGKKALLSEKPYNSAENDRDTIPPVFEVRDFIPEEGKILSMPVERDVYIEARGFSSEGQLYEGNFTLLSSHEGESFEVELEPVMASDTLALPLNILRNDYLKPGEHQPFRIHIPLKNEYRIYFNGGDEMPLKGVFMFKDANGILATGDINQANNYIMLCPGQYILTVSGINISDEGSFGIGIAEKDSWLEGDTLAIELGVEKQAFINQCDFIHFKTSISEKGLYKIDVKKGISPSLDGRFRVTQGDSVLYSGIIDNKPIYLISDIGQRIISVAGKGLTDKGNFNLKISREEVIPLSFNDSINESIAANVETRIYSIVSNKNTMLRARFYYSVSSGGTRQIRLLNSSGKILGSDYLYSQEKMLLVPMAKDSVIFLQLVGTSESTYILIVEEDEQYEISYGDTVNNSLKFKKDKNLHHFQGYAGDFVSIRGSQLDHTLYKGSFNLLNEDGLEIARRGIYKNTISYDYEIVYKLPTDGRYSILVESAEDYAGSYQLILDTVAYKNLFFNDFPELDVLANTGYYFVLNSLEDHVGYISVLSGGGNGNIAVWSQNCERLNLLNNNRYYSSGNPASYAGFFKEGLYFLKVEAKEASEIYINFAAASPLSLNSKGETSFCDTISLPGKVNAYYFQGGPGDGVHGIIKKRDDLAIPDKIQLKYFLCSGDGTPLYADRQTLSQYSLDSTILDETAGSLTGSRDDTTWLLIAHAESQGIYDCSFYHVKSDDNITVDDDFVEYPGAQTSSAFAASYAITELGHLLIANGEYSSYLPLTIKKDNVILEGQDKEEVLLRNMYNNYNNPVIYYSAKGGVIRNLSLSCGNYNYWGIYAYGDNVLLESIEIKPLAGRDVVAGGVKGVGLNMVVRDVFLNQSMWGLEISSDNGLIENCNLITESLAISLIGENTLVRNNTVTGIKYNAMAISVKSGYLGTGNQVVENNHIAMLSNINQGDYGIISIEKSGKKGNATVSYIRNNTINNATGHAALNIGIGNPPSKVIVENNRYNSINPNGSRALRISSLLYSGSSDIIVRNNIFDGLRSWDAIEVNGADGVGIGQRFAIYNNNFRIAATAPKDTSYNFIRINTLYTDVEDTLMLYFVNNIFEGNGYSYFAKCQHDFSFFSDYNIVYNFRKYIGTKGTIIGKTHDLLTDPLFIDADLRLAPESPAINNGASPSLFEFIPELDIDGITRPQGTGYDIGAYER